jgi:hypothetical protein
MPGSNTYRVIAPRVGLFIMMHDLIDKGTWKVQQRTSGYRLIANANQPCKETNP